VTDLISLVLTDIEMPEMDGYILTKKIKSDPRFVGVPVIMHSSLSGCPTSNSASRSASTSMCPSSNRSACRRR
jgi:CheY-like chemotaxis protein